MTLPQLLMWGNLDQLRLGLYTGVKWLICGTHFLSTSSKLLLCLECDSSRVVID